MRGRFTTLGILLMALVMTATACSSVAESPMQSLSFEVMNSVVAESQYEGVTGTVNAAEPTSVQMQIREMQEIPEGNHYQEFVAQYIKDHAVAVGSAVSVPVYYEEQILYSMECFAIGQDAGLTVTSSNRHSFFENMVTLFPDPVLREIGDYVYICYDTENDTRLYVFYSKEKDGGMYTDGFPIIMKKTLSYADFAGLKPGDGIEKVEAIDPVVPLYMPTFNLYTDGWLNSKEDHTNYFQTIHLLTGGVLRINYDKIDGEYVITRIIYCEDFILDGLNGQTCYQIYEEDYKG